MAIQQTDWTNLENWYSSSRTLQLYNAFATCNIVRKLRRQYIDFVGEYARDNLTVLELGTGPGHHLEALLAEAGQWPLSKLTIVGVDLSRNCLGIAKQRLAAAGRFLPFQVEFVAVQASFDQLKNITLPKADIAASSLALHHLPWDQKRKFLRFLYKNNLKAVFIGEVDALLDRLPQGSEQLNTNTCALYKAVFKAVRHESGVSKPDALGINREFFLPEVKKVRYESYEKREEYFIPARDWQLLLKQAGFCSVQISDAFCSRDKNYRLAAITAQAGER